MKKVIFLICLSSFYFLLHQGAVAQKGAFAVRLAVKSFDCATKKMVLQVQVKANNADSTFLMGDANYRFSYSTTQLSNPSIVSEENFSGNAPANQSAYQSQNLEGSTAGPTTGIVSLNTIFAGRAGAKLVTTDWTTVSCIGFDVLTLGQCYTVKWQKDTDFPRTGMNEIIVGAGSSFNYTTKNVRSGKVFENVQVCSDQFCTTPTGQYSVRLNVKSYDCDTKKVVLQVQVRAANANSTFLMGDANYRFNYPTALLGNPQIVSQENFSSVAPASDARYTAQDLNGSTAVGGTGIVSLNTKYSPSGTPTAKTVGVDWMTVACISMDYKGSQTNPCFDINWQTGSDFPVTGMNEVNINGSQYTLKDLPTGVEYGKASVCPSQLCVPAGGRYGVRLTLKEFNCQTKKATFRVQVRAANANSTFLMGDANYRFNYPTALLGNPQIVSQENFSSVAPASDARYTAQDLNGSTAVGSTGIVSLNTKYSPSGTPTAKTVGVDWMTVACISMDYKGSQTNPCFDINWQTGSDFPLTGMNEVNINGSQYTLKDLPTGVEYGKGTLCPVQECSSRSADLSLYKTRISAGLATVGSVATFRLVVKNAGADTATNVVVTDSLPASLQWQSSTPSLSPSGKVLNWNIAKIAPGDSAILTINTKILTEGVHFNKAEITAAGQQDPNSTPGNNNPLEDDYAQACVSVPIKLCSNQEITVVVPGSYTNVRWFRGSTQVGTGNSLLITQAGTYTVSADAGSCPAEGCCPIIVEAVDCCPPDICVPFTIKQTKKAGVLIK